MDRFVSIGGTYKSHGNCSPVAEYNYWCDAEAASYVFEKLKQTDRNGCGLKDVRAKEKSS